MMVDSPSRDEQEGEIPNHMTDGASPTGSSPPPNQVPLYEPLPTSPTVLHPLLPDPISSAPQYSITEYQQVVKEEEESRSEFSVEQPLHPLPKVKMSLHDLAPRKKKQREEQEMTKSVQDSLSGVDLPTSEGKGSISFSIIFSSSTLRWRY